MRGWLADSRRRHGLVAAAILMGGLVAAVAVYITADAAPADLPELSPDTSKKYLRDLELYGGTANVLAVQLETWLQSLWRGRRLAYTVAAISLAVALGYFFFTVALPPCEGPDRAGPTAPHRPAGGRPTPDE